MFKKLLLLLCFIGNVCLASEPDVEMSDALDVLAQASMDAEYLPVAVPALGQEVLSQRPAMYRYTEGIDLPYQCSACDKCFSSFGKYSDHALRIHVRQALFPCFAPGCSKKFVVPATRNNHCKKIHNMWFSEYPLRRQILDVDRQIVATLLGREPFINKEKATWLQRPEEFPLIFQCCVQPGICEKYFNEKGKILDHLLRHLVKSVFVCPCSASFYTPNDEYRHMREEHGKNFRKGIPYLKRENKKLVDSLISPTMYKVIQSSSSDATHAVVLI